MVLFDNLRHTLEPLRGLPHVRHVVTTDEEIVGLATELRQQLDDGVPLLSPPIVLVIDDLSQVKSVSARKALTDLASQGASRGLYVLASGRTADLKKWEDLEKVLLRYRSGLFVGSHTLETDAAFFDINLPTLLARERLPRGRGYLVRQGEYRMVQVATPGDSGRVQEWVQRIAKASAAWASESATWAAELAGTSPVPSGGANGAVG